MLHQVHHQNILQFFTIIFILLMSSIPLVPCKFHHRIHKRQLFREQLLPNSGGKVPDSAFQTDRLALNQLNARGIYSSTGVYLEHRHPKEHPTIVEHNVRTMKVPVPTENRFVSSAGRYHYQTPPSVDTTYVIREPVAAAIKTRLLQQPPPQHPVLPYTSLKLARYYRMRKGQQQQQQQHQHPQQPPPHQQQPPPSTVHYPPDGPKNDIEDVDDFVKHAKKEYEPYLKKIHEVDK